MAKKGLKEKQKQLNAKVRMNKVNKEVADKTFGMKNKKKSQKVQKIMKNVANTVGGYEKMRNKIYEEKKKKEALEKEKVMMGKVFGKVALKADSNLCAFFKAGLCNKGRKCKFSHQLESFEPEKKVKEGKIEGEKIDLFTDQRDLLFGQNKDVISNWDSKKLNEVVDYNNKSYNFVNTDKVCKNFLMAVEKKIYGWLWVCPNGPKCHFRHALPKDYVFKTDTPVIIKKKDDTDLIHGIDDARNKLDSQKLTPVTKELFDKWLIKRTQQKEKERKKRIEDQLKEMGVKVNRKKLTGKQLFDKQQAIFKDAEGCFDNYTRDKKDEDLQIDEEAFSDEELPDF